MMNSLQCSFLLKVLSGISMGSFSLLAIFGNSCVIIAMIREKRLQTISNLFILSLSISDLMIGLFIMPMSATIILNDKWIWGFWACQGWLTIDYIASTASIFNLLFLSIDRLWSILEPLRYMSNKSKTRSNITIICIWVVSALWLIPINFWPNSTIQSSSLLSPTVIISNHSSNLTSLYEISNEKIDCETDFETNKSFKIITTTFNFYVPLIGMIFIYGKIFHSIKSRSKSELLNPHLILQANLRKSPSRLIDPDSIISTSNDGKQENIEYITLSRQQTSMKGNISKSFKKKNRKSYNNLSRRNGAAKQHIIETLPDKRATPTVPCTSDASETTNSIKAKLLSKILVHTTQKVQPTFSPGLKQQIKAAKQLGILLLAFLVFWLPYSVMFLVVAFCSDCISSEVSMLCVWLGYINSAVNPILYPLCNNEFRAAFRKMFRISPSEPTRRDIINILYTNKK